MKTLAEGYAKAAEILGTDEFDQSFSLWAAFVTGQYDLTDHFTANVGFGYAERAPNLTELYVAQSFLFLLQNGLNTATGDPLLRDEIIYQLDFGVTWEYPRFRGMGERESRVAVDHRTKSRQ